MYGQFKVSIDEKKRIIVPSPWRENFKKFAYITEEEGLVRVYPENHFEKKDFPRIFKVPIRGQRITVPAYFKESVSFRYSKKVILAGYGEYFEIWPADL